MTPVEVANKLIEVSKEHNVPVHLLGGIGVYMICPSVRQGPLARTYNDVDVVIPRSASRKFTETAIDARFEPDRRFNSLQADRRMLFYRDDIPIDVFVGVFEQCHTLNLESRLPTNLPSLKPEDLLLTKLQVVQITEKDLNDSIAILLDHDVGPDERGISPSNFCGLLASDWGWYTTVTDNLKKLIESIPNVLGHNESTRAQCSLAQERASLLLKLAENTPKSAKWKIRSKIGRRLVWYEIPEDKKR